MAGERTGKWIDAPGMYGASAHLVNTKLLEFFVISLKDKTMSSVSVY